MKQETTEAPGITDKVIRRKLTFGLGELFGDLFEYYGVEDTKKAVNKWFPDLQAICEDEARDYEE